MIILCLFAAASLIGSVWSCPSNRVYFGSLNTTHAAHMHLSGIYVRQPENYGRFPVYKHEKTGAYLYYLQGNLFGGFWAIGRQLGGTVADISVQTTAKRPEDAQESWMAWEKASSSWMPIGTGMVLCVTDDFYTCTSGEIELSGIDSHTDIQFHRMGTYKLTNITLHMRPVYEQTGTKDNETNYIFYNRGVWVNGYIGDMALGMLSPDDAWRPEYIVSPWVVFTGRHFREDTAITIACKDYHRPGAPSIGSSRTSVNEPAGFSLDLGYSEGDSSEVHSTTKPPPSAPRAEDGQDSAAPTDACDPNPCQNGGECRLAEVDSFICQCTQYFYGPHCEQEINCGRPRIPQGGRIIGKTGSGVMDRVFFACQMARLEGPKGSVCQLNGAWTDPPECVDPIEYPTVPILAPAQPLKRRPSSGVDMATVLSYLTNSDDSDPRN